MAQGLRARVHLAHSRSARFATQRALAALALPLWLQALKPLLPGWMTWSIVLLQGGAYVMVLTHAALEIVWKTRAARLPAHEPVEVHVPGALPADLRFALLDAVTLLSVVPWLAAALGRPVPPGMPYETLRAGLLVAVVAVALEAYLDADASAVAPRPSGGAARLAKVRGVPS